MRKRSKQVQIRFGVHFIALCLRKIVRHSLYITAVEVEDTTGAGQKHIILRSCKSFAMKTKKMLVLSKLTDITSKNLKCSAVSTKKKSNFSDITTFQAILSLLKRLR